MDAADLRILAVMQEDARLPVPALAERVGLSAPACYRRIRLLRESGAIEREVALVAPRTMGWPVTMLVMVMLETDRGRVVDDLMRRLRDAPEVTDVWYVTGDSDMVLHVAAQDMEQFEDFTRRTLHAEENVRSFKTLVVLKQTQRGKPLLPPNAR